MVKVRVLILTPLRALLLVHLSAHLQLPTPRVLMSPAQALLQATKPQGFLQPLHIL